MFGHNPPSYQTVCYTVRGVMSALQLLCLTIDKSQSVCQLLHAGVNRVYSISSAVNCLAFPDWNKQEEVGANTATSQLLITFKVRLLTSLLPGASAQTIVYPLKSDSRYDLLEIHIFNLSRLVSIDTEINYLKTLNVFV